MAEGTGGDEGLEASVAEQLRAKAETEQRVDAERGESERRHRQVEERKAEERATVLAHTGGERRLRPRREAARGGTSRLPGWLPAAVLGAVVLANTRSRRGALVRAGVPLAVAAVLLAGRWRWGAW